MTTRAARPHAVPTPAARPRRLALNRVAAKPPLRDAWIALGRRGQLGLRLSRLVWRWQQRSRQRSRQCADLARLDARRLQHVGVDAAARDAEVRKRYWQP